MNSGQTLAHYEIIRPLGKGGMGEVYLAEDTKLKREVALKFLPEAVRSDSESLRRFRIEAEAAAKLNHPNIATIHSIEEADDQTFITMEYVDGETLSDHIPNDGLDIDQFFDWFIPLTDALAHAHEHGRIHRDLKPGNIMIASNGTPKILDFGLARIEREESGSSEVDSDAPTMTMKADEVDVPLSLTQGHAFLGTPAYMSPEQIEGKKVDARTDLFSFGIVMYEAITGQRPFKGDTVESMIARILEIDPEPVIAIKPITPYTLWQVIRNCLRKDREARIQNARMLHADLKDVQQEIQTGTVLVDASMIPKPEPISEPVSIPLWRQPMAIAAMVLMLIVGGGAIWLLKSSPDPVLRKFQWTIENLQDAVISPDGKHIAYIADDALWIRNLENLLSQKIPDTQNATQPSWSQDGSQVSYFVGNALWKVAVTGRGAPTKLCEFPSEDIQGVNWRKDGSIVVGIRDGIIAEVFSVSSQSGNPQPFFKPDPAKGELDFVYPHTLPDGENLLLTMRNDDGTFELINHSDGLRKTIVHSRSAILWSVYAPTGHIVYELFRQGIWAVPFSSERLTGEGEPFLVASGGAHPSIADDGTLVYISTSSRPQQLTWVDREGRIGNSIGQLQERIRDPILSPDGLKLVVALDEKGDDHVWIYDIERGARYRLVSLSSLDLPTTWSPSGDQVVFSSMSNLYSISSDGNGQSQKLIEERRPAFHANWSRDGQNLVYHVVDPNTNRDLWYLPLKGEQNPLPFLETPYDEAMPMISPDGQYIAYQSNASGQWEIYIQPFPKGQGRQQASVNGGMHPKWNPQGQELFYIEDNALVAVSVQTDPTLRLGIPQVLFSGDLVGAKFNEWSLNRKYEVSSDGQRFVVVRDTEEPVSSIVLVENWYKEFEP